MLSPMPANVIIRTTVQ